MHHLSNSFIKEEPKTKIKGKLYFSFSIVFSHKTRTYQCEKESDYKKWITIINTVTGYEDLNSSYTIGEILGRGNFGVVKGCTNKLTGQEAAIKIIDKDKLTTAKLLLMRNEIEILKICQHPNIIKMYDVLENQRYIYISIFIHNIFIL